MAESIGSMKDGGKVKKTGLDKASLGEATKALATKLRDPKDSNDSKDAPKSEKPKHGLRTTDIESHFDGSHTVRHTPYAGDEISYAVKDTGELQNKIKQYLSGEGEQPPAEDRQAQAPEQTPTNALAR